MLNVIEINFNSSLTLFEQYLLINGIFQTHEVVIPVYSCMRERKLSNFIKATLLAMIILLFLYTITGTFGYITFGSKILPDVMVLYDASDPVVLIGIGALIVKMITTYPPLVLCGR